MPILAEEYDTALREIRSLRLDLKAQKTATYMYRDEAKRLSEELQRVTAELCSRDEELRAATIALQAARADAEALQAELGRVRGERDLRWQPIETAPRSIETAIIVDYLADQMPAASRSGNMPAVVSWSSDRERWEYWSSCFGLEYEPTHWRPCDE